MNKFIWTARLDESAGDWQDAWGGWASHKLMTYEEALAEAKEDFVLAMGHDVPRHLLNSISLRVADKQPRRRRIF